MPPPRKEEKTCCGDEENPAKEGKGSWKEHVGCADDKRPANQKTKEQFRVVGARRASKREQETIRLGWNEESCDRQSTEVEASKEHNGKS